MKKPLLGNPQNTIEVLKKHHFTVRKKYSQNFLIDTHVLEKIVQSAELTKDDVVLEIGPGIGTLTQALSEAAGKVIGVEIDEKLIPILADTLSGYDNVHIIQGDILKLDLQQLATEEHEGKALKVVANLPYHITTPVVMHLLQSQAPIDQITVMVQEEVAQRMQATPGTKDYGALSLAVQYYAKPSLVAYVPPHCFMPRPKVGSAVVQLFRYADPPISVTDEQLLFRVIRASFNQRRKTLANGISHAEQLPYTREDVTTALRQMGKEENVRGEALTLQEFADLSECLKRGEEDAK